MIQRLGLHHGRTIDDLKCTRVGDGGWRGDMRVLGSIAGFGRGMCCRVLGIRLLPIGRDTLEKFVRFRLYLMLSSTLND